MDINNILKEIDKFYTTKDRVINYLDPHDITKKIDLNPINRIQTTDQLIDVLNKIIKYSVKIHNPMFLNQLYKGSDRYSAISELIIALLNTNMHCYEIAPVFTIMEEEMFKRIKIIFQFTEGDVIFSPGASMANIMAIHLARYNLNNNYNSMGMYNSKKLKIFVSEDSHYSLIKGASLLGLGYDSIIKIPCINGHMMIDQLKKKILETISSNNVPLIVIATAGTTVLGAFDPIDEIADICHKYNIWFHIDGALGGMVIFSDKYNHLLKGIEKAQSFVWNPHKMLRISHQCTILMARDKNIFKNCNHIEASYIFQTDKYYQSELDSGRKYIQCGRKADILKLWLTWES